MSFDLTALRDAVAKHGPVVRVVIADMAGSSPRETGAAMLVWAEDQSGTIGGGALEYEAAAAAREMLAGDTLRALTHHALGPDLGQCCGGRVSLFFERFEPQQLTEISAGVVARPVKGGKAAAAFSIKRLLAQARAQGTQIRPQLIDGWMIEPVLRPTRHIWIWGAGHVGRALVHTLAPLPEVEITWVDISPDRFPDTIPEGVTTIPQPNPADLAPHAPHNAEHLVLTYSHALDLELCHRLLGRGFRSLGLIGSATKWARFRKRLAELGHRPDQIAKITCPIGDPSLGKHPQQIAIGVAQALISTQANRQMAKDRRA